MEYTKNYQLPTWVKEDRIRMEDFNNMTDKLDAAIAAVNQRIDQVNPVVKLKEVVLTQNQSRVDIDLSDVDWDLYREVQVWFNMVTADYDYYKILFNNDTGDFYGEIGSQSRDYLLEIQGNRGAQSGTLRILPGLYVGCIIEMSSIGSSGFNDASLYWGEVLPVQQVNFMSNNGNSILLTGSKFCLYGLKK